MAAAGKRKASKRKPATGKADATQLPEQKARPGRPSSFTQATADIICDRLVNGESMRTICRDESMPSTATVCKWLGQFPQFAEQYARAREMQADTLADESLEIADDARNDWMEKRNAEGKVIGYELNHEHVQRSKLRIEQRRWFAGKVAPKKYGDKVEHSGPGGGAIPVGVTVRFRDAG